jgi:glyoxylase-like metal-dependent hydrolase (beta-lactamase superfamily II)
MHGSRRVTAKLYAHTCGHLTIPTGLLLEGAKGRIRVPVPAYLIVHPRGKVLFDSGLNLLAQTDLAPYMGEAGLRFASFHFAAGEEVSARIESMQVAREEITHVVNSHLHYDHAGGNAQLPNADVVVQRREWRHALALPDDDPAYRKRDFDTGQRVREIDGEHDLFGDGCVVCLPSYGHTPGHQSLRVRTERGEFVLCGDACYLRKSLEDLHAPGVVADREAALSVLRGLRSLQAAGARIMYGHDPEFWKTVAQGPERLG